MGSACAVHPHGRGDNVRRRCGSGRQDGSPPRAWGQCGFPCGRHEHDAVHPHGRGDNHKFMSKIICPVRFTPTGVGTMFRGCSETREDSVHPHGRGDNVSIPSRSQRYSGSPPRAWGQFCALAIDTQFIRFTPTGVGTMATKKDEDGMYAVHPHGRGDNGFSQLNRPSVRGSPPRAWGQL